MTEKKPSEITDVYWVIAHASDAKPGAYDPTAVGKWLLFVGVSNIDDAWELVRAETEAGRLGIAAKASTARQNPNARPGSGKLICVYTRDYRDSADVGRVLARLREIGFKGRLSYKTDQATLAGQYGRGTSIYTSPPGSAEFISRAMTAG